jgi:serine/arginine repetitive matrix protein 2
LIGGSLVAINEVTKKQVTSIDLRKAVSIIDLNDSKQASTSQRRKRGSDEGLPIRERSFMVEFDDGEGITFSSDKDEDKVLWYVLLTSYWNDEMLISRLETLNGLIGKIPSNPLWAELLAAQKREEDAASASATLLPNGTKKVVRKVGSTTSLKSKRSASGIPRSTSGLKKKEKAK